jgi:MinD-like ATPase involved in chromosome partitioning or flagellar assembly
MRGKKRQQQVDELLAQLNFPQSSIAATAPAAVAAGVPPVAGEQVVLKSVPGPAHYAVACADARADAGSLDCSDSQVAPDEAAAETGSYLGLSELIAAAHEVGPDTDTDPVAVTPSPDSPAAAGAEGLRVSDRAHGAAPVAVRAGIGGTFRAVEYAPPADVVPAAAMGPAVPAVPAAIADARAMAAAGVLGFCPVPVLGIEGGAGRTTVCRMVTRASAALRAAGDVVCLDAVPLWGRLTAEVNVWGPATVTTLAEHRLVPEQWMSVLSSSAGVPVLPGPRPGTGAVSSSQQVLDALDALSPAARLVLVDTAADPTSGVPSVLLAGDGPVVVVATGSRAGVWGVQQLLEYCTRAGVRHIHRRVVVVVRGKGWRWPAEALAAVEQLRGLGVETVRVPYIRGLDETKPPRKVADAGERALAAVIARAITQ